MLSRNLRALALSVLLSSLAFSGAWVITVSAQSAESGVALQRGYRTGYSDGYMAGYRDTIDSVSKDYARHADYSQADRAYNKDYGTIEDYRNGYQQGFESGYDTGFEKRSFEQALPTGLAKRETTPVIQVNNTAPVSTSPEEPNTDQNAGNSQASTPAADTNTSDSQTAAQTTDPNVSDSQPAAAQSWTPIDTNAVVIIPRDTELIVVLQQDLNTEKNREGERFIAKVVSPSEIAGATVEGHISKIAKPGRIRRRSELSLSFDRILLNDSRWSNFSATLTEVMPVKGDNVSRVDTEGTAFGKSTMKKDGMKIGGATGTGLLVGAIAGGPVGAAVGAGVGAALGVGAVVIERGKHIRLNRNQQLTIKTSYETQIR